MVKEPEAMDWTCGVPVLRNPVLLRQAITIFGLAPMLPLGLIGLAWLPEGAFEPFLRLTLFLYGLALGLLITALATTALFYRRGMSMRFRIDSIGFSVTQDDRRADVVSTVTTALGAATSNVAAAGAGALARASTDVAGHWSAIASARFHDRLRAIELRNSWRTVAVLYCAVESYPQIAAIVRRHLGAHGRSAKSRTWSPPVRGFVWTAFTVLCLLPGFFLQDDLGAGLMPMMVSTAFAVATVWMLPALAWALLAGLACSAVVFILAVTGHGIIPGPTDRLALVLLTVAGQAALALFAIQTLCGRFTPILAQDLMDLDGNN